MSRKDIAKRLNGIYWQGYYLKEDFERPIEPELDVETLEWITHKLIEVINQEYPRNDEGHDGY